MNSNQSSKSESSQTHGVEAELKASASLAVDTKVITYPRRLLTFARKLIDEDREFGFAVVVAHMACEVATERTLSELFAARGVPDLEDSVTKLLNGYSLANNRIRRLYTALTGDQIEQEPFWAKFTASAERRNKVVHKSPGATEAEANESHQAATDLVTHLKK